MYYVLYRSGKKLAYCETNKQYWKAALPGIIAFSLNEGLRWGRGLDYNLYFKGFQDAALGYDDTHEILFSLYCRTCHYLGIDYKGFIISTMLLLIISVYFFLKKYRKQAAYALPLFCLLMEANYTNLIRWYMGVPFILIGFALYMEHEEFNNKKALTYLMSFSLMAMGMHTTLVLIPIIYYALYQITKNTDRPLSRPIVSIPIFVALTFLFKNEMMLMFASQINFLLALIGDSYSSYSDNLNYWLEGGAAGTDNSVLGIAVYAFLIPFIILGYDISSKKQELGYTFAYNLFSISFILMPIAVRIELLNRFWSCLYLFSSVVGAYLFIEYFVEKKHIKAYAYSLAVVAFLGVAYSQFVLKLRGPDFFKYYVWDSKGKDIIDIYSTYYIEMNKK